MKIVKSYLPYGDQKTNVMYFLPEITEEIKPVLALFTHGYTADKSSILNWPIRLAEVGVSCALFDIPGHYLGNFSEVSDFEHFKGNAHYLFLEAFKGLTHTFKQEFPLNDHMLEADTLKVILCGHSLGAMLALKAIELLEFEAFEKRAIGVGLGMAPKDVVHLFDTPFYKSTLKVREQLVSPELKPDNVFPWIKAEKENLVTKNKDIHLITGEDDLVVGSDGMERLKEVLEKNQNRVTLERPSKLPHHEPQAAASYVKKYVKKISWI